MTVDEQMIVCDAVARLVGALAPHRVEAAEAGALLVGDLGYDSLRLVELAMWLEEVLEAESGALDEAQGIQTVGDLQEFALAMVSEGRASVPAEALLLDVISNS